MANWCQFVSAAWVSRTHTQSHLHCRTWTRLRLPCLFKGVVSQCFQARINTELSSFRTYASELQHCMCNWCRALTSVATVSPAYRYSSQVAMLWLRRSIDGDTVLQLHCTPARDLCLTNWKVRSSGCAHWHNRTLAGFCYRTETLEDELLGLLCSCTQSLVKASTMRSDLRGHPTGRPAERTENLTQHQYTSVTCPRRQRPAHILCRVVALHGGRTALHAASAAKPQVLVSCTDRSTDFQGCNTRHRHAYSCRWSRH